MRSDYITPEQAARLRPLLTRENRLVLDMVWATGFRIGDMVALESAAVEHAQHNRNWLHVWEEKTGKRRAVRVPGDLLQRCAAMAGERYVFQHRDDAHRHRTRQTVWAQLSKVTKAWPERVSPHSYRKLYAVGLYQRTGDIEKVRRALGHGSVATTLLYATSDVQTASRLRDLRNHRRAA